MIIFLISYIRTGLNFYSQKIVSREMEKMMNLRVSQRIRVFVNSVALRIRFIYLYDVKNLKTNFTIDVFLDNRTLKYLDSI